jgi:hypothetical protein
VPREAIAVDVDPEYVVVLEKLHAQPASPPCGRAGQHRRMERARRRGRRLALIHWIYSHGEHRQPPEAIAAGTPRAVSAHRRMD